MMLLILHAVVSCSGVNEDAGNVCWLAMAAFAAENFVHCAEVTDTERLKVLFRFCGLSCFFLGGDSGRGFEDVV